MSDSINLFESYLEIYEGKPVAAPADEPDPFGRPGGKYGGVKKGGGYDKGWQAIKKENERIDSGKDPATKRRYKEMKENVSSGNARRARFGGITQRVSDSEANTIKNKPYVSVSDRRKKAAEEEKKKKELAAQQQHKDKLENLSNQNPRGGISGNKKALTKRTNGKKVKETPIGRAKRKGDNIETVPLHLRKTPKEHESGRRRLNILRALRDRNWGTPAANHDWRQEKRSKRSERLGLKKEDLEYILDYFVSEGYTNTYNSAIPILESMSDEWLEDILDEANALDRGKDSLTKNIDRQYRDKPLRKTSSGAFLRRGVKIRGAKDHKPRNPHYGKYYDMQSKKRAGASYKYLAKLDHTQD